MVRTTKLTTYPTSANSFFLCQLVTIGGEEIEGKAITQSDELTAIYAANVGTGIPPIGTLLRVHPIDGRWAFAYY